MKDRWSDETKDWWDEKDRRFKLVVLTWLVLLSAMWGYVFVQWHPICQRAALTILEDTGTAITRAAVKEAAVREKQAAKFKKQGGDHYSEWVEKHPADSNR